MNTLSTPGVLDDQLAEIDLERAHPFFGSAEEADRFAQLSILRYLDRLPENVRMVDFGGGQGLLADGCQKALLAHGREASVTVVDVNASFAADSRARGLRTRVADLASYRGDEVDVVIMRLVLHYNSKDKQRAILANALRHLAPGGVLVLQFETGTPASCLLRNRIAQLSATWCGTHARFWADEPLLKRWLDESGLIDVSIEQCASYSTDLIGLVRNAWARQRHSLEQAGVDAETYYRACTNVVFESPVEGPDAALEISNGRRVMKTHCPIVLGWKKNATDALKPAVIEVATA